MDARIFMKKLDRIDDLPTLSVITIEVNKMLKDYNTSINDLSLTIKKDQAMVPKLLKLVNSAFFGFQSKISNIDRAIVLLGYNAVRNALVSVSVINAFSVKNATDGFDIKDFWIHSIAVAVTSKHLAEMTRLHSPEDSFTAGLLHDIGKIVLSQYFQDLFEKVLASTKKNGLSFFEAEKKEIPATHARIGAHLAQKWQLPQNLVDSIKYHHIVSKNVCDLNLLMIVHVADILTNCFLVKPQKKLKLSSIHQDALKAMKPQIDTVSQWLPAVSEEIKSACNFFLEQGE